MLPLCFFHREGKTSWQLFWFGSNGGCVPWSCFLSDVRRPRVLVNIEINGIHFSQSAHHYIIIWIIIIWIIITANKALYQWYTCTTFFGKYPWHWHLAAQLCLISTDKLCGHIKTVNWIEISLSKCSKKLTFLQKDLGRRLFKNRHGDMMWH